MKAELKNTAIVIPAYNAEKYLAELISQISAIIDQDNIIVINDASTDSTLDICKKLNLKVLNHLHNKGKRGVMPQIICRTDSYRLRIRLREPLR